MDEKYIKLTQEWYSRGFEAGGQSRQAEINALKKRIDEASEILSQMKHNGAYKALDILKGNKND